MLKFSDNIIYVHIEKDAFTLFHVQQKKKLHIASPTPFSNTRLAVAHFNRASETLEKGVKQLSPFRLFKLRPVLVMHQLYLAEGGLCEIEERILRELAEAGGGRDSYVWEGPLLSPEQLLNKGYIAP